MITWQVKKKFKKKK